MNDTQKHEGGVEASVLFRIEQACDEFQSAWRAGRQPTIEDFLSRVAIFHRARLFEDLLAIELDLRHQAGDILRLEPYRQRFAVYAKLVESVFRRVVRLRRLGDYELLEELGHGGMGVVYRARQVYLDQIVAVKVLPPECLSNPQLVARFLREMKSIGSLDHPNIVRASNAGQVDGVLFLAMEYLDGIDMYRLVEERFKRNQERLSVATVCELVRQAAEGLQHAHERGLVHRDIKPSNLMLASDGRIRVLDLGLAHFQFSVSGELTASGQVMGTVDYMSPEQAEDTRRAGPRSDIYSLGCTVYYLLTGEPVYGGHTITERILAHRERAVPSLNHQRPDVPDELDALFQRMVAKRPEERPLSMNEVIAELEKIPLGPPKVMEETAHYYRQADPHYEEASTPPTSDTLRRQSAVETRPVAEPGCPVPAIRSRQSRGLLMIIALALTGIILCGVILRWKTRDGMLVIEVDQADARVEVDGGQWSLTAPDTEPVQVELTPGEHTLKVTRGGFETYTKDFRLKAGGSQVFRVHLEPLPKKETVKSEAVAARPPLVVSPAAPLATAEDSLPGIIWRPANLPGVGRWQVDTVNSRGHIWCLSWSPDGKSIALGCGKLVRVVDGSTLKVLGMPHSFTSLASSVVWSPDGRRLALGSNDGTICLWNVANSGKQLVRAGGAVLCLAWSPDGKYLASASADGEVRLWDSNGRPGYVLCGHRGRVWSVAWSPDSQRLVSAGDDKTVRLWRATGTPEQVLEGGSSEVIWAGWNAPGQRLAAALLNGELRFWNAVSSDQAPITVRAHPSRIWSAAWSPDGQCLATAALDSVRIWRPDGTEMSAIDHKGNTSVAWRPDSGQLVIGDEDGGLSLWGKDGTPGTAINQPCNRVFAVAWSPDSQRLASGGTDAAIRIWHLSGSPELVLQGHSNWVTSLAWTAGKQQLASGSLDGTVRLWSDDGTKVTVLQADPGLGRVAWNPDGTSLVCTAAPGGKSVCIWDRDGTPTALAIIKEPPFPNTAPVWISERDEVAIGCELGVVQFWDRNGKLGRKIQLGTLPTAISFSPDGRTLVAGTWLNELEFRRWDGTAINVFRSKRQELYSSFAWRFDGNALAVGLVDGNIQIWNPEGKLLATLPGHMDHVYSVTWSSDGKWLASASHDGIILVHDAETFELRWIALMLRSEAFIVLNSSGEVIYGDREIVDKELFYQVEMPGLSVELLMPSEFQKRVAAAGHRNEAIETPSMPKP